MMIKHIIYFNGRIGGLVIVEERFVITIGIKASR